jgi:hypothetical protein
MCCKDCISIIILYIQAAATASWSSRLGFILEVAVEGIRYMKHVEHDIPNWLAIPRSF